MLVSGGDQDEDLVHDGWTDIFRNLTGTAAKEASRKLGRRLASEERAELMELMDYKKMNQVRARVDSIVKDPEDRRSAEAVVSTVLQTAVLPRRIPADVQPAERRAGRYQRQRRGALTERGVVANGKEYELDCLIFATGFEVGTSYTRRAGYDIIGRGGVTLSEHWADGLRTLHGMTTHGFPNCFFLGFTQTAITISVPQALNEQAEHVVHMVTESRARGAKSLEPTPEGEANYVDEVNSLARIGAALLHGMHARLLQQRRRVGQQRRILLRHVRGGSVAVLRAARRMAR